MLTAKQVAARLQVPLSWVYDHSHALGAFQPMVGARILFSEKRIAEIEEGRHACSPHTRG